MKTKTCSKCKIEKPIKAFEASRFYKDGYRGQCAVCRTAYQREYIKNRPNFSWSLYYNLETQRDSRLKRQYGISTADYDEMHISQGGCCAICRKPSERNAHGKLYVDHCHKTGRVRGLLCSSCNRALGAFGDNATAVKRALDYLKRSL